MIFFRRRKGRACAGKKARGGGKGPGVILVEISRAVADGVENEKTGTTCVPVRSTAPLQSCLKYGTK